MYVLMIETWLAGQTSLIFNIFGKELRFVEKKKLVEELRKLENIFDSL